MKKIFNPRTLLFATAAGIGLSALSGAALAAGNDDRVLRLSILAPLTTIDPHRTVNLQDDIFLRQIYESLYHQNEKTGEYQPRIAESYTTDSASRSAMTGSSGAVSGVMGTHCQVQPLIACRSAS